MHASHAAEGRGTDLSCQGEIATRSLPGGDGQGAPSTGSPGRLAPEPPDQGSHSCPYDEARRLCRRASPSPHSRSGISGPLSCWLKMAIVVSAAQRPQRLTALPLKGLSGGRPPSAGQSCAATAL